MTNLSYTDQERVKNLITEIDKNLLASHLLERKKEETMAIENINTNPKYFFTYAKKHLKTKGTIGPLRVNNKQITSNEEISQCLAEQYSSTFSIPNPNHDIGDTIEFFSYADDHTAYLLTDITFTKEMLIKEIGNIKKDSAPGPDHFPVKLLQECAMELSEPLYLLWRHSLDTGDIATIFKQAIICPIQKPNSQRSEPKSYRPVSLTSHIIKVFERVIRGAIVKHLEKLNLLPKNQHGFISGRSTLSQLLHQIEHLIRA